YSSYDTTGKQLPCGTACVAAEQCGAYRPAFPFPNPQTSRCERCPWAGCAECSFVLEPEEGGSKQQPVLKCRSCREGFSLDQQGLCIYILDQYLIRTYMAAGCICVCLLAVAVVLYCVLNRNSEALAKGLEHRERCVPHLFDAKLTPFEDRRTSSGVEETYDARAPSFPLNADVHNENIVGVGLVLYYNHLVFVGVIAAFSWFILTFTEGFFSVRQWDALQCGFGSSDPDEVVLAYAHRRGLIALFLWVTVLLASIIFARMQASTARSFDRKHTRMEDYTLSLSNVPPEVTDPNVLQKWVEDILGKPIEGVSIGYDFRGHEQEVEQQLDDRLSDHLEKREARFTSVLGVPGTNPSRRPVRSGLLPVQEGEEATSGSPSGGEGSATREWLSKFRGRFGSGEAFVVMKQEEDVERFFALWDQPRGVQRHHTFMGAEITLREVTSEPTSIVWCHLSTSHRETGLRLACAAVFLLIMAVTFNLLLFFPLSSYVLRYALKAGAPPTRLTTSGLGLIIAIVNSLIDRYIWYQVPRLGFRRKDQADILTFGVRTVMVLVNTLALVTLTARKLAAVGQPEDGILLGAGTTLTRSEELGREGALADAVQYMFLSSTFTFSYIMFWLSYPSSLWQAVFVIRTGLLGKFSLRDCERWLEPMEIWLPWDYASHIQLTCCAFFPLYLAEPPGACASRVLCAVLVLWCAVMYGAQRVVHLRASKETFFTTHRLDKAVMVGWALPVSQLAGTSAWWGARALGLGMWLSASLCLAAFLGSCCLYWILIWMAYKDRQQINTLLYAKPSESYRAALARLRYSYFNTNPVHVLLSDLRPEMGLPETTWYAAGKAYLQAADPKKDALREAQRALAEHAPGLQRGPRSFLTQLTYGVQVWFTGAPKHAYHALDETIE
ncbi:unnamed protein product, partial [Polarella glacialis]